MEKILSKLSMINEELAKAGNLKREIKTKISDLVLDIQKDIESGIHSGSGPTSTPATPTYAAVAAAFANRKPAAVSSAPEENLVLIVPVEGIDSNQTRNIVKEKINPECTGIKVNRIRNTRNGGILLETETKQDSIRIMEEIKKHTDTFKEVRRPSLRNPHILIHNLDSQMTPERIKNCLEVQNNIDTTEETVRYKFKMKTRNQQLSHFVLEVSPKVFKLLMSNGHLYLGLQRCILTKFTLVTRCFCCQKFGHRGKECQSAAKGEFFCGRCGDKHETRSCTNENVSCINCSRYNEQERNEKKRNAKHPAIDRNCPCFRDTANNIDKKTNYGN